MSNVLPISWILSELREITEIGPKFEGKDVNGDQLVHFVPMAAVAEEFASVNVSQLRPLCEVRKGYTYFLEGDVLFAKITPCMENGKGGLVPDLLYKHAFGSTEFHVLRSFDGIKPKWVAYYLSQSQFRKVAQHNMTGTAGQLRVPTKWLGTVTLPVAPTNEQTRIVEKLEELLSDLDEGVAELKTAQKKLALYRQSLLKAAVEGALTTEWRKQNKPSDTGAQLLERILTERRTRWEAKQLAKLKEQGKTPPQDWQKKYPEPVQPNTMDLPELPEGWAWATIDQLSFVVRGASPRPAGDPRYFGGVIPWITVGSLTADEDMYLVEVDQFVTEAGKEASRFIEPNTLLLTNSGATLGVPKITKIGGCINDGSVAFLDIEEARKIYLYWYLSTQTKKLRALNQGAAQPNLNTDIVRKICVPICSSDELEEINRVLEAAAHSIKEQAKAVNHSLKQSAAQRQNILRAAFSGQLVPQDPNDEPASVLLERIRAERAARETDRKPRERKAKKNA
ncbi:MAG: restriction endonuclease subunit S [Candidatus Contendobacter sp.]